MIRISGGRINVAKEFKGCDSFRVQVHPDWFLSHQGVGLVEGAQDLALPRACIANDKDGVSDVPQFLQLNHFQDKMVLGLQPKILWNNNVSYVPDRVE